MLHLLSALIIVKRPANHSLELTCVAHAWEFFEHKSCLEFYAAQQALDNLRPVYVLAAPTYEEILDNELPSEFVTWMNSEPTMLIEAGQPVFNRLCRQPCGIIIPNNGDLGPKLQIKMVDFAERAADKCFLVAVLDTPSNGPEFPDVERICRNFKDITGSKE